MDLTNDQKVQPINIKHYNLIRIRLTNGFFWKPDLRKT